jgi:hypothetical protein
VSSLPLIAQWGLDTIYLVRSTSFILLQGVPPEVSLEDVRSDILAVEGVHSVHELHIWQLSETKIIASVHINASREVEFMPIATDIRGVLHKHGIHSSTIQPEYHPIRDAVLEERSKVRDSEEALSFVGLILNLYSTWIVSYHVRQIARVLRSKRAVVSWRKIMLYISHAHPALSSFVRGNSSRTVTSPQRN